MGCQITTRTSILNFITQEHAIEQIISQQSQITRTNKSIAVEEK